MRKVFKIFLYIIGGILALLLIVVVLLNTPFGKEQVRSRAEAFLRSKLKTEVHIGKLGYGLPKYVVLEDVLLKDQAKDTLVSFEKFEVDIDMLKLIHKQIDIKQIELKGVHAYVHREIPDTNFNFSYIINAFTGGPAAADKQKPVDTAKEKKSSPLAIDIDRVLVDDVHIHFNDHTGGTLLAVDLEHLLLKVKKVDLANMKFHVKTLEVAGLQTAFTQDTSYIPPKPDTAKAQLSLIADNIDLQRISVSYNDNLSKMLFALGLGKMQVTLNNFDLNTHIVDLEKFNLDTTNVKIVLGKKNNPIQAAVDTVVKIDTTQGWHVTVANVALAGVNFKMDNDNAPKQKAGIDYQHLDMKNFALKAQDVLYTSDTVAGNLQHMALQEQSGLDLKELKTKFNYNPKGAYLRDLFLQTSNTLLQNYAAVSYPSLAALKKDMGSMGLKIDLSKSIVGMQDILIFAPQLESQPLFRKYKKGHWLLDASLDGYIKALDIKKFHLSGIGSTEVALTGRLNGMPDAKKINYNLNIQTLKSSREEVSSFLPPAALASVRLPDRFGVAGHVSGTTQDYNAELVFASTDGNAYLKGTIMMSPGKGRERYDLYVKTQNLNLGNILKKDSLMGAVTADFKVKGQSFDVKTMNAVISGNVAAAQLKGYNYHGMSLNGNMANKVGDINLTSTDANLHLQLNAHADLTGKYAAVKAKIAIDSADLQALKLYKSELRLSGVIEADFPSLNPDYPNGELVWHKPVIVASGQRYVLDSLYILSRSSEDTGLNIVANLDVLNAKITGKTPLTKIGDIIQDHINRHYAFTRKDSTKTAQLAIAKAAKKDTTTLPGDYSFKLVASVVDAPLLHSVLPGLTSMDSIHVDADLTPRYLKVDATVPNIVYGSTIVQNGLINVSGTDSAFTYKATVDKIAQSKFAFWYTNVHGNLDQDGITANISIADSVKKERFALVADLKQSGDTQTIELQPGLMLNYQKWDVTTPNRIVMDKGGMYIQNFGISNAGQYIKANSDEARSNTPLKVDISNFLLSDITQIISKDTLLANGVLGGNVTLQRLSPTMEVNGQFQIQNLSVMNDTIGNLQVQVSNTDGNKFDAKLGITGNNNDVALNGSYYLTPVNGNNLDFDLNLNALSLASVQGLAMNQIKNSSGYLRGKLHIVGPTTSPDITGTLTTDQMVTTVSMLNAYFKFPSDKIEFNNNKIAFNDFQILDSAGNKATLTGNVDLQSLDNIKLDMHIAANNWRALHSTIKDNKLFYGDLLLTTNLDIKGTPSTPSVDGSLNILKNTNLTVTVPESNPQLQSTAGIVEFINRKDTGRYRVLAARPKKDTTKRVAMSKGSDINVNVNVDKSAQFSVVIDQASGDFVKVRGEATLNASVDPGGNLALSGNYELDEGTYQMNYNFIKRRFAIQKGSTITFAGDPMKARADITAVYEADVPPYDLIQNEVPDQSQLNYYKQRLPFNVDLNMKGHILKPAITFNVELPENKIYPLTADQIELIQGKLTQVRQDTSELNKQVFALLILSRFVADDPFQSGVSSSLSSTAMASVSSFIGQQLNNFANKLVKGVDFNVDLASTDDYTTGTLQQRTDLNVSASKRLLNDRLKLTVGNDFELEGPQTNNNDQNNLLPTNLAADYLLTADGRYTMRAYRKDYDEGVLEGFVTETGLDFIVSLDYNHFRNVFKKKKNQKKEQATGAAH